MAPEKVTEMVMTIADLKCPCCYKKVKKLLCKFPQVRNQVFDDKQNTVSITVVCCSPEEIRRKLAKEGGKTVKSVVIKEPPKPKETEKPKPDKPKETEKPKSDPKPAQPKETEKPKSDPKPVKPKETEKPKSDSKPKSGDHGGEKPKAAEKEKPKEAPPAPAAMMMAAPQVPMGYPFSMTPPDYHHHPGEASGYGPYARAVPGYDNYGYGPYGGEYYANNNNRGNYENYWNDEIPSCTIM